MAVETAAAETLDELLTIFPYKDWQAREGLPLVTGYYVEDLDTVELGDWPSREARGAFVNLEGTGGVNDLQIVEIPPGGATAPTIMNLFHSDRFIFDNPFRFDDRFTGEEGYFGADGKMYRRARNKVWETNFVPDVRTIQLHSWKERGAGGMNVMLELAKNTMGAHISRFPIGTYKKAHRHGPGAHVIILDGIGFSTLWQEGDPEPMRCNWKPNSVVVPPNNWFHQHFNTGPQPARYLALKFGGRRYQPLPQSGGDRADVSIKQGGYQLEYEDEDREVHARFEAELRSNGAECRMKGLILWCTGTEGPPDLSAHPD